MPQAGESAADYHDVTQEFWDSVKSVCDQYGLRPSDFNRLGIPWKTAQAICEGTQSSGKISKGTAVKLQTILKDPESHASGANERIDDFNSFLNMDFEETNGNGVHPN
tara:strand:+ start:477 stop:800 length:324 start_codon:yes stop_codon:yes gene_type:complete